METARKDGHAAGVLPDLLTVEEAAVLLRVGRNTAYGLTRQWRISGGRTGMPVVEFGRQLRVPRHALEQMLGVELTAWPPDAPTTSSAPTNPAEEGCGDAAAGASNVTPMRRRRRSTAGPAGQISLFAPATPTSDGR